jgi:Domain of unknown function (DUF4157)
VVDLAPGQMRRGPFLAALRGVIEAALSDADPVTRADASAHFSAVFAGIQDQDAAAVERSVRQNLPDAEITDAQSCLTAAAAAAAARVAGHAEAVPASGGLVGRLLSAVGGLASALLKARDGAATGQDARLVGGQLGTGQALDGSVRAQIESAYGRGFGGVRVHTDATATNLSARLGARAFTVGEDIAFGAGEYQPGTPAGDALIAHELAHVAQQDSADDHADYQQSVPALEEDADRAAVGAVVSRWTGSSVGLADGVLPRLRAGLRLQRCVGPATQVRPAQPAQSCANLTPDQWRAAVTAATALPAGQRGPAMTRVAEQALCGIGIAVNMAGTAHPDTVHPDDYVETPVLNFDPRLNDKNRWSGAGGADRPMGSNAGYNFLVGTRRFAVIGPNALNPNTPLTTQQYAQHELSLVAMTQPGGRGEEDLELRQWTEDFRNYFHQYLSLPIPQRPGWQPLIQYYENAAPGPRQQALNRLVDYYNNPPVGAEAERVRRQMRSWTRRRSGALITDLDAALPAQ